MIGSIIGDIAGSVYEFVGNKDPSVALFPAGADFTDDSVLTVATAAAILEHGSYQEEYRRFGRRYPTPTGGYGLRFASWLKSDHPEPYGSWGNGSAMRAGPVGWAFATLEQTLAEAKRSAEVTHNHPHGIRGAQATAAATWWARHGQSKMEIRKLVAQWFGYDLPLSVAAIRETYAFNESCQGTVPQALVAFLDSHDFESAIRNAISLGGDADTIGCITGGIAQAFYREIPEEFLTQANWLLPEDLRLVVEVFHDRYCR